LHTRQTFIQPRLLYRRSNGRRRRWWCGDYTNQERNARTESYTRTERHFDAHTNGADCNARHRDRDTDPFTDTYQRTHTISYSRIESDPPSTH
jgi:hypothetical protein